MRSLQRFRKTCFVHSKETAEQPVPLVSVVDDDAAMAKALRRLLLTAGWRVRCYDSGEAFLSDVDPDVPGCVLLDVRMPETGGFRVMSKIVARDLPNPVIFISGFPDVRIALRAVRSGAVDFLPKPFEPSELLETVENAVELDSNLRRERAERDQFQTRLAKLTNREREILPLLLDGKLNKQIAYSLGISQRTVEVHRHRIMKKMQADSVIELLGFAYCADDASVPAVFRRTELPALRVAAQLRPRRAAGVPSRGRAASGSQGRERGVSPSSFQGRPD